jgi:hypothetical protein
MYWGVHHTIHIVQLIISVAKQISKDKITNKGMRRSQLRDQDCTVLQTAITVNLSLWTKLRDIAQASRRPWSSWAAWQPTCAAFSSAWSPLQPRPRSWWHRPLCKSTETQPGCNTGDLPNVCQLQRAIISMNSGAVGLHGHYLTIAV